MAFPTILSAIVFAAIGCAGDPDFVRVVVRGTDPSLTTSPLDLQVHLAGGGRGSDFSYQAQWRQGASTDVADVSDFTVSFPEGAPKDVDVRVSTRPSGAAVDWGGDVHVTLPGDGRTLSLSLARGESAVSSDVSTQDGDLQSLAAFGTEMVLAWPSKAGRVAIIPINPDRPAPARPAEYGAAASKIRVSARPSGDFTSELFAASWVEEGARPMLKTRTRTSEIDLPPVPIGAVTRATDLHVAVARRTLKPALASAVLVDDRVLVHTHDEAGGTLSGPFEGPELASVNRIAGLVVTPEETVTLAVNGNGARLVQLSTVDGRVVHAEAIEGRAVAIGLNADGSRILVAAAVGVGDDAKLKLETFSVRKPTRISSSVVAPFSFVPGVPESRVSLAECAIAWPAPAADGSGFTDVVYQELEDGRPVGSPHFANVTRSRHHFAPTVVCLSASRVFLSMLEAPQPSRSDASLMLRRLPTGERQERP